MDRIVIKTKPGPQVQAVKIVGATSVGVGGVQFLSELKDVNVAGLQDGDVLIYDSASGKWVVEILPEVDGGTF